MDYIGLFMGPKNNPNNTEKALINNTLTKHAYINIFLFNVRIKETLFFSISSNRFVVCTKLPSHDTHYHIRARSSRMTVTMKSVGPNLGYKIL